MTDADKQRTPQEDEGDRTGARECRPSVRPVGQAAHAPSPFASVLDRPRQGSTASAISTADCGQEQARGRGGGGAVCAGDARTDMTGASRRRSSDRPLQRKARRGVYVFTMLRSSRSRSSDCGVHDGPKRALGHCRKNCVDVRTIATHPQEGTFLSLATCLPLLATCLPPAPARTYRTLLPAPCRSTTPLTTRSLSSLLVFWAILLARSSIVPLPT